MMRLARGLACALLVFATLAAAPTKPAPTPTASPTPNPAMLAQARACFAQLQSGKVDRSQLAAQMNADLTTDRIDAARR